MGGGEQAAGAGRVVFEVGTEEGDAAAEAGRGGGEQRQLVTARRAPGGPDVDEDRVAPQRPQPRRQACKLWSSQPFQWQISDKFDVPAVIFRNYKGMRTKKYDDTQWHLKAINKDKTSKLRFLSVIQVSTDGKILNFKELPAEKGITKLTIGGWEIEAALSYNLAPQLNIRSLSGSTVFAAYGSSLNINNQSYKAGETGNAMLAEMVNGKITFSETADVPVRPLR